jgi:outer membrane immunogenic protein
MFKLLPAIVFAGSLLATGTVGNAADVALPPPPGPVPFYVAPPFSWTGFYLGDNAGAAWIQDNITDNFFGLNFGNRSDFIAGGQIGVNYQVGVLVFGVEGDLDWAANSWRGRAVVTPVGTIQATTNNTWIPTLAARLGIPVDHLLFYGKAGGG